MAQFKTKWQIIAEGRARTQRAVSESLTRRWPKAVAPVWRKEYRELGDDRK